MSSKKSIDFIIENSSNPYLKEVRRNIGQNVTMEDITAVFEYEHGLRLASSIKKEFALLKRNDVITELENEHGNSLALIIETESQKYALEELKKNFEILTEKLKDERDKLQRAMDEIRTLKGIVPICASCKKIRDDKGYWTEIEAYVSDHSEADFSHGICPDCAKKLYPDEDLYDETAE